MKTLFRLMVPSLLALMFLSGCAPDKDHDGIRGEADKCPGDGPDDQLMREDYNGIEDDDGCPDADMDGDGEPDVLDRCPGVSGVSSESVGQNGCPETPAEPPPLTKTPVQLFDEMVADPTAKVTDVEAAYNAIPEGERTPDHAMRLVERQIHVYMSLDDTDYLVEKLASITDEARRKELALKVAYRPWLEFYKECPKGVDQECNFLGASKDPSVTAFDPPTLAAGQIEDPAKAAARTTARNKAMRTFVRGKLNAFMRVDEAVEDKAAFVREVRGDVMGETPITGVEWELALRAADAIDLPQDQYAAVFVADPTLLTDKLCNTKGPMYAYARELEATEIFSSEIGACLKLFQDDGAYTALFNFALAADLDQKAMARLVSDYNTVADERYKADPSSVKPVPPGIRYEIIDFNDK